MRKSIFIFLFVLFVSFSFSEKLWIPVVSVFRSCQSGFYAVSLVEVDGWNQPVENQAITGTEDPGIYRVNMTLNTTKVSSANGQCMLSITGEDQSGYLENSIYINHKQKYGSSGVFVVRKQNSIPLSYSFYIDAGIAVDGEFSYSIVVERLNREIERIN